MKQHLLRLFAYNAEANSKLIKTVLQLPAREASIKLMSHLITAQDKWRNRITAEADDSEHQWFGKVFDETLIEQEWRRSILAWIRLIESLNEMELEVDILFIRPMDGQLMKVRMEDIALQVNYHSIHHRAQINKLISEQGITPPATDFILMAISKAQP